MIKIENLSKFYSSNGVVSKGLENINLELNKGEFVAIVGESGSGKSTLLNVITQMDTYDDGEIYFNGEETSYFNEDDISEFKKNHVSFIFQNYNLLDSYTVLENVMLPLLIKGISKKEAKEKAKDLIEKVGLTKRINNKGSHLSGGEKQRVSIARALASDAEILACDEATGNLDSKTREEIVNLIKDVCKDKLVLYVTHNYEEIKDVCTRTIYLKDNKIIKDEVKVYVKENENKQNDFDYKSISLKTKFLVSLKNIFATPKKNILIFSIILVMSILFTFLINGVISATKMDYYSYNSNSFYLDENYALFKGNTELDLKGEVFKNPELSRTSMKVETYPSFEVYFTPFEIKCNEFIGTLINDNSPTNHCNLYLPYSYSDAISKNEKTININVGSKTRTFHLDGIGYTNNINKPMVNFNYKKTDFIEEDMYLQCVTRYLSVKADNISKISYDISINRNNKPIIKLNKDLSNFKNLNVLYKDKSIIDDYEIIVDDSIKIDAIIEVSPDYLDSIEEEKCFYTANKRDFNKNIEVLKKNNIKYYVPYLDKTVDEGVRLGMILSIAILIVPFIIFFILTRLILNRVYQSKIKEYSIIRMLGVNNKDMQQMVILESFMVTLVSMLLGYFLTMGVLNLIPRLRGTLLAQISPLPFMVFFIIMLLFSLLLSLSFSKILYKDSSIKTIKEEAL